MIHGMESTYIWLWNVFLYLHLNVCLVFWEIASKRLMKPYCEHLTQESWETVQLSLHSAPLLNSSLTPLSVAKMSFRIMSVFIEWEMRVWYHRIFFATGNAFIDYIFNMHFLFNLSFFKCLWFYLEILVLPGKLALLPASGMGNVTWASSKLQVRGSDLDSV